MPFQLDSSSIFKMKFLSKSDFSESTEEELLYKTFLFL